MPDTQQPEGFQFKIESAVVEKKSEGILFYVLPPLVVAAVFAYCACAQPSVKSSAAPAPAKQVQKAPADGDESSQ